MAMLAEPRQRKRYNLTPKGKALYEDDSRFGTKMLERMGWKKGEGLGASSEGSKDFIRIRFKNDAYGLGYEQRDDQWTQHEQCFNGLLKTLNNEETSENLNKTNEENKDCEDELPSRMGFGFQNPIVEEEPRPEREKLKEKISGVSLEERSKQSKARVHYKKFTKGKDLAQYSEKDLANIFGKKAVDEQQANDYYANLNSKFGVITEEMSSDQTNEAVTGLEADQEKSATKKREKKNNRDKKIEQTNECQEEKKNIQLQTFTSNLSVQDYFKKKMDAIRNKKSGLNNGEKELDNISNTAADDETKAEVKKKKKKTKIETQDLQDNCAKEPDVKKSKKIAKNTECFENEIEKDPKVVEKKQHNMEENAEIILEETKSEVKDLVNDCLRDSAEKESKKIKRKPDQEQVCANEDQDLDKDNASKKSKRNKNTTDKKSVSGNIFEDVSQIVTKKTKKPKSCGTAESTDIKLEESNCHVEDLENNCGLERTTKKLKKNKTTPDKEKPVNVKEPKVAEVICQENGIECSAETILPETIRKKKKDKSKSKVGDDFSSEIKISKKRKLVESEDVNAIDASATIEVETNLLQDPTKKKKKRNKNDLEKLIDSENDEPAIQSKLKEKKKKTKLKKSDEPAEEIPADDDISTVSSHSDKKSKKELPAKSIPENDGHLQVSDLEEVKKIYQGFNIYPISSFCAEKFRHINLNDFKGSSLHHIEGYGLSSDLQLDIQVNENDEKRIINLWKNTLNKYELTDKPKKTYKQFIRESIMAKKTKTKVPKLYVKTWQRKNAFQLL